MTFSEIADSIYKQREDLRVRNLDYCGTLYISKNLLNTIVETTAFVDSNAICWIHEHDNDGQLFGLNFIVVERPDYIKLHPCI